ncbi:MAG: hypothetical protein V1772_14270, partial [Chloroflexota bacterium]
MRGNGWQRSSWASGALGLALFAAMRALWVAPVIQVMLNNSLVQPRGARYPFGLALGVLLLGAGSKRALGRRRGGEVVSLGLGVLVALGSVVWAFGPRGAGDNPVLATILTALRDWGTALPTPLIVLAATAALWFVALRSDWSSHDELWNSFTTGTLALSALMLLRARRQPGLTAALLAFALVGLCALALSGAQQVLVPRHLGSHARLRISRLWLSTVWLVLLAAVVLGWGVGVVLSPQAMAETWALLRPLWAAVVTVARAILVVVAYVIMWLLTPLIERLRANRPETAQEPVERGEDWLRELAEQQQLARLSPPAQTVLTVLVV